MAKIDWSLHQEQFAASVAEAAQSGINFTVKDYCEIHGLNARSAQRYLSKKAAKNTQKIRKTKNATKTAKKTTQTDGRKNAKNSAQSGAKPSRGKRSATKQDTPQSTASSTETAQEKRRARARVGNKKDEAEKPAKSESLIAQSRRDKLIAQNRIIETEKGQRAEPFTRGNLQAIRHGCYLSLSSCDEDIRDLCMRLIDEGHSEIYALTMARMAQLDRITAENKLEIDKTSEAIAEALKQPDVISPEMLAEISAFGSPAERRGKLFFASAQLADQLVGTMQSQLAIDNKYEIDTDKQALAWRKAPAYNAMSAAALTAEILTARTDNNWTAVETAEEFLRNGIPTPPIILAQAQKEISWLEPAAGLDGGMPEEQREAMRQKYLDKYNKPLTQIVKERQEALEQAMREAEAEASFSGAASDDECGDFVEIDDEYEVFEDSDD